MYPVVRPQSFHFQMFEVDLTSGDISRKIQIRLGEKLEAAQEFFSHGEN